MKTLNGLLVRVCHYVRPHFRIQNGRLVAVQGYWRCCG